MAVSVHKYNIKHILIAVIIWEVIFWSIGVSLYYYMSDLENFRFENEYILCGLALIPIVALGYLVVLNWKNKTLSQLASDKLLRYLTAPVSEVKSYFKFFLFRNALAFLILALANPQYGKGRNEMVAEGIEIMIALDISNSMRALDLDPNRDRLTVAKMSIDRFLRSLHGDKVGILVFAGDAFLQVPLTADYRAIKMFLQTISPDMMTNQGTSIGLAIDKCIQSFDMENGVNKAIIVMSDGEDHEGDAEAMARSANEMNIIVNTVGMGTQNETPIPEYKNGEMVGLKEDAYGKTVYTKLNEEMLVNIAQIGGGTYVRAEGNYVNLEGLMEEIRKIEKTEMESSLYSDYEDQFHWFLALGLVLLFIEFFITENRSGFVHKLQEYDI
ncbi:MAG: VWA domain-containing protein [Crocinitomicaceae bacterium]|nr:VWA domain-containing protein [Crocinitomicaceae bacterium]